MVSAQLLESAKQALGFLSDVVPSVPHLFCTSKKGAATPWSDMELHSHQDVVASCFTNSEAGYNIYFALSSFSQEKAFGKYRTQTNAAMQKALWLDVDCGKSCGVYKTATEGVTALHAFIRKTHLPIPYIVSSGHGLHVYWPFEEAIRTAQWKQLASYLKTLCVCTGFDVDHSRTMDAASVLRLPGTKNYDHSNKYDGSTQPVSILVKGAPTPVLELAKRLITASKNLNAAPVKESQSPRVEVSAPTIPTDLQMPSMGEDLLVGPKRTPLRIVQECAQIRYAGTGDYNRWYNMITVLRHCEGGERAIHILSQTDKHRYSFDNTQTKIEEAARYNYGPCRCITFNDKTPGVCHSCPYWGKITSPIQLGEIVAEDKPVRMQAPDVNTLDNNVMDVDEDRSIEVTPFVSKEFAVVPGKGVVWFKKQLVSKENSEDDESRYITHEILINDVELYIHSICVDNTGPELRRSYVIRKQVNGRIPEDILFDVSKDLGPQSIISWLGNHGMLPIKPAYNKQMSDFMNTYIASIQNKLPEIKVRDHFGWVADKDKRTGQVREGFVVGTSMYTFNGVEPVKLNERATLLAEGYAAHGDLETWKHIPDMYRILNQPYPALMMCAAFGAPFMRLGAGVATNIAYSLWDIKGGKGKSTALEAIASVWGNPDALLQTKNDTVASRFQKYAVYRNLPVFVDEVTNMQDGLMADMVYDIVNGREKSRSTASGTGLARSGAWDTVSMFTSNKSLYEMLRSFRAQSTATCMRVIEMQCDFKDYSGTKTQDYITLIQDAIRNNYGLTGPAFMRYCFAHPEVMDEIAVTAKSFVRQHMQSSDERFWLYGIAIPLAAARIANRAGLLPYDVDGWLMPYVVKILLPTLRRTIKQDVPVNGSTLFTDFLNEHIDRMLVVTNADRPAAVADMGGETGLDTYIKRYPRQALCIRKEQDTGTYYISAKSLKQWCQINNHSLDVLLQELKNSDTCKEVTKLRYALGKDVSLYGSTRSVVYKVITKGDIV